MPLKNDTLLSKGKKYCFRLLKIHQRSQQELEQRLTAKRYPLSIVRQLIADLKRLNLLDDKQLARDWVKTRSERNFGRHRIRFELQQKGLNDLIIARAIKEIIKDENEEVAAQMIAQKRFLRYKDIEQSTAQRRVYQYLLRRGFSDNIALKAIRTHNYDND